jgi:hypothetical protein
MVGMGHRSSPDMSMQSARRMYDTFYRQDVELQTGEGMVTDAAIYLGLSKPYALICI